MLYVTEMPSDYVFQNTVLFDWKILKFELNFQIGWCVLNAPPIWTKQPRFHQLISLRLPTASTAMQKNGGPMQIWQWLLHDRPRPHENKHRRDLQPVQKGKPKFISYCFLLCTHTQPPFSKGKLFSQVESRLESSKFTMQRLIELRRASSHKSLSLYPACRCWNLRRDEEWRLFVSSVEVKRPSGCMKIQEGDEV